MKKAIKHTIWGIITAVDLLGLALMATLFFNSNCVMYWLMDTTYGVYEIAAIGGILGLLSGQILRHKLKAPGGNQGFRERSQIKTSVSKLSLPVNGLREGK